MNDPRLEQVRMGWQLWAGATAVFGISVLLLTMSLGYALIPIAAMLVIAALIQLAHGYEW